MDVLMKDIIRHTGVLPFSQTPLSARSAVALIWLCKMVKREGETIAERVSALQTAAEEFRMEMMLSGYWDLPDEPVVTIAPCPIRERF